MTTAGDPTGMTVLLVEDEPDVRLVVSMLLRRTGLTILQASDGREAIEVLDGHRDEVDVVLLDVLMPELTGPEALPHLRQLVPDLPVVFYSGYDRGEVATLLSEDPPYTSFLSKPADRDVLVGELRRAHTRRG